MKVRVCDLILKVDISAATNGPSATDRVKVRAYWEILIFSWELLTTIAFLDYHQPYPLQSNRIRQLKLIGLHQPHIDSLKQYDCKRLHQSVEGGFTHTFRVAALRIKYDREKLIQERYNIRSQQSLHKFEKNIKDCTAYLNRYSGFIRYSCGYFCNTICDWLLCIFIH